MNQRFDVFGPVASGMVLQSDQPIRFSGRAGVGEKVTVHLGDMCREVIANPDGWWLVELPPQSPGGPMELVFSCEKSIRLHDDVWIGQVWFCSGQSNIEWNLRRMLEPQQSRHRRLFEEGEVRIGYVPNRSFSEKDQPLECENWLKTAFDHVPVLPASLSVLLNRESNVKVGIVSAAIGGSPISTWIPQRVFSRNGILKNYLETYPTDSENAVELHARWLDERAAFDRANEEREARGEAIVPPSKQMFWGPRGTRAKNYPGGAFESMARPVLNMALAGVLWYQGETDAEFPTGYADRLKLLIESWREENGNPELPFVVVQLPSIEGLETAPNWPHIREAQLQACDASANTFLVPTLDLGNPREIHPAEKWDFAERIAPVIRAILTGTTPQEPKRITGFEQSASNPCLSVKTTGTLHPKFGKRERLRSGDRSYPDKVAAISRSQFSGFEKAAMSPFEIRQGDGEWISCPVEQIESDHIILRLPSDERVSGVRYGWKASPGALVHDFRGWPVLPSRSDSDPLPRGDRPMY